MSDRAGLNIGSTLVELVINNQLNGRIPILKKVDGIEKTFNFNRRKVDIKV